MWKIKSVVALKQFLKFILNEDYDDETFKALEIVNKMTSALV